MSKGVDSKGVSSREYNCIHKERQSSKGQSLKASSRGL